MNNKRTAHESQRVTDKETGTLTKKTDKHEPVDETIQENAAAESAVVEEAAAEQESYTLTAEEFAAAKAHIEAITKEKDETVVLLQRIQADFDNFRRRNASIRLARFDEIDGDAHRRIFFVSQCQ